MTGSQLVSVVVPVFNGEPFLRHSLDSILAQSHAELDVIVVDDASTDASPAIAAEVAAADERVRLYRQATNVGQFANVNTGLGLARGEFVAVYHADDVYDPEIVAREVEYLRAHPQVGAVFALASFIDVGGREFGRMDEIPPEIAAADSLTYRIVLNGLLRHTSTFLPTPTALVRRRLYTDVGGFRSEYGLRGDLDMWVRLARRRPLGLIQEHLVQYRVGHANESKKYGSLRTGSDLFFAVMDEVLASGGRRLADPDALNAYEGHRAADLVLAAANAYVLERPRDLRAALRSARPSALLATRNVQRWRLLVLLGLLQVSARLPRSRVLAGLFWRRWHGGQPHVRTRIRRGRDPMLRSGTTPT